jgi:hypothetical protein
MALLFDFCVDGPPLSQQASAASKQRWKAKVRAAAEVLWPTGNPAMLDQISARITYYHDGKTLDVDNMSKPILDALCGLIYGDDAQISDASQRRRDINGSFRVRNISPHLAKAFATGTEFVHVEIFEQPDQQDLS